MLSVQTFDLLTSVMLERQKAEFVIDPALAEDVYHAVRKLQRWTKGFVKYNRMYRKAGERKPPLKSAVGVVSAVRELCRESERKCAKVLDSLNTHSARMSVCLEEMSNLRDSLREESVKAKGRLEAETKSIIAALCTTTKNNFNNNYILDSSDFLDLATLPDISFNFSPTDLSNKSTNLTKHGGLQLATILRLGTTRVFIKDRKYVEEIISLREISGRCITDGQRVWNSPDLLPVCNALVAETCGAFQRHALSGTRDRRGHMYPYYDIPDMYSNIAYVLEEVCRSFFSTFNDKNKKRTKL